MPLKFQARSKDQEILEEGGGAGPSNLPRRDDEYGDGAGLSKLDLFCFESSKLFINSSAADIVFSPSTGSYNSNCGSAQVAGQWRGDTAFTLPLFWRRSTVSPVFFGRFPRSSLHSVVPAFPLRLSRPVANRPSQSPPWTP